MRLSPYESFANIQFGAQLEAVLAELGEPQRRRINPATREPELWYADVVIRITGDGVEEVSARPSVVLIGADAVPIRDLADYVRRFDPDAVERVGYVMSSKLGLMVDLDHEEISSPTAGRGISPTGRATGTKTGTRAWWGATAVVQPATIADADGTFRERLIGMCNHARFARGDASGGGTAKFEEVCGFGFVRVRSPGRRASSSRATAFARGRLERVFPPEM